MSEKGVVHGSSDGGISAAHPVLGDFAVSVAPATSDGYNLLRFGSKPIACWRVDDLRFLFDSSFLSPHLSREIKHLWVLFETFRRKDTGEYPRLSVFGHADPSGDDDSNKLLSGRRAKALYALLLNGADPAGALSLWKEIATAEKWGADHRALMQLETKVSKDAPDDLLFHAYLDWLSTVRSEDGVPAKGQDGQPIKLKVPASQFLGGGVDPKGKASYQGCSSFNPKLLFSQTDESRYQKAERENQHDVLEERNRANRPNRRVVVRIFEMYVHGLGCRAIATILNNEGVPSPLKGQSRKYRIWTTFTVAAVLKNEKYGGVHVWNRSKVVRNARSHRKEQRPRPTSEWERIEVPAWRIISDGLWSAATK